MFYQELFKISKPLRWETRKTWWYTNQRIIFRWATIYSEFFWPIVCWFCELFGRQPCTVWAKFSLALEIFRWCQIVFMRWNLYIQKAWRWNDHMVRTRWGKWRNLESFKNLFCSSMFKDSLKLIAQSDRCRRFENITKRGEMPMQICMEWIVWRLGDWFYGTILCIYKERIYISRCRLHIQIGRSHLGSVLILDAHG